jgi:myosin-crossreactive antigen
MAFTTRRKANSIDTEPNSSDDLDDMSAKPQAFLVGGGIGFLAAAAFMIRLLRRYYG